MSIQHDIQLAVGALKQGGVIAYPTEHCFGLGCDPNNQAAIERLLKVKQRNKDQGVILVAATIKQVALFADLSLLSAEQKHTVESSWPGPNTWLLPTQEKVSNWVRGQHEKIAMRISAHPVCEALCNQFEGAIVSTSANRHQQAALLNYSDVVAEFEKDIDFVVNAPVGGDPKPSTIRDALSGKLLR